MADIPKTFTELPQNINSCEQHKFGLDDVGNVGIRTINQAKNSIGITQTILDGTAKLINTPEGTSVIQIKHMVSGEIVYIGNNNLITTASDDVYPLIENETLTLIINKNQENEIYALTDGTSVTLYAIGGINV